jgi:hypothetical protein
MPCRSRVDSRCGFGPLLLVALALGCRALASLPDWCLGRFYPGMRLRPGTLLECWAHSIRGY